MEDARRFARIVLAAGVVAFAAPGFCFLLWPDAYAGLLGIALDGALARTDVRALFGGLELGVAVALALCLARRARTADGLALLLLALGGMLAARTLGLWADGPPGLLGAALGLVELALLGFAAVAWQRLRAATASGHAAS
jgi:hypothetical protein